MKYFYNMFNQKPIKMNQNYNTLTNDSLLPYDEDNTTYTAEDFAPRQSHIDRDFDDDSYSFFPDVAF
jgi:hypothetical protein